MNKLRRAISRLRSDLNFAFISKNIKMLDTDEKNNKTGLQGESSEDLIGNGKYSRYINIFQ